MRRFITAAGILIGISAFFYLNTHEPELPRSYQSLLPGRDEVAASGSIRLSMNGYETLRSRYSSLQPLDQVKLGLYAQWLLEKRAASDTTHERPTLVDASHCIRALMKPTLSKSDLRNSEVLLLRKFSISTLSQLEEYIHNAWRGRSIDWNPDLVKEYGIVLPNPA